MYMFVYVFVLIRVCACLCTRYTYVCCVICCCTLLGSAEFTKQALLQNNTYVHTYICIDFDTRSYVLRSSVVEHCFEFPQSVWQAMSYYDLNAYVCMCISSEVHSCVSYIHTCNIHVYV